MRAGSLNEVVDILGLVVRTNEYGEEEAGQYVPRFRERAQVQYNSGGRVSENNELFHAYSITFNLRMYADGFHAVDELDIVRWQTRRYRILEIERNRESQMQRLRCELIND